MKGGSCGTSFCPMAPQMGGKHSTNKRITKRSTKRNTKKRSPHRGGNYSVIPLPTVIKTHSGDNPSAIPDRTVMVKPADVTGGYRVTARDKKYLSKWKRGKPIGFTMRSSLKAKGLIPRANGKKRISVKYRAF